MMPIRLGIFISLLVVFVVLPTLAFALGNDAEAANKVESRNLLYNGSFAVGLSGWQVYQGTITNPHVLFDSQVEVVVGESSYGQRHLRLTNMSQLTSDWLELNPSEAYMLSADIKLETGRSLPSSFRVPITMEIWGIAEGGSGWMPHDKVGRTVNVGSEWQRYSLVAPLPATRGNLYQVRFVIPEQFAQAVHVSFDAIQLEQVSQVAGEFAMPSIPELGIDMSGKGNVFLLDEPATLSAFVYNPFEAQNLQLKITITDFHDNKIRCNEAIIRVGAGETLEQIWDVTLDKRGYFRVEVRLEALDGQKIQSQRTSFVVVDRDEPTADRARSFGVAVVGNPDIEIARMAKVGVETVRVHEWRSDERTLIDRIIASNIEPIIYTGAMGRNYGGTRANHNSHVPADCQDYENWWFELARDYRDIVSIWQVINEPYHHMNAEDYTMILRAAYTGIKRGNPDATVIGITGDPIRHPGFIDGVLRRGGLDYLDVVSIHLYVDPDRPENRFDGPVSMVRDMMLEYSGKEKPLWVTEMGWTASDLDISTIPPLTVTQAHESHRMNTEYQQAVYMVRAFMVCASLGIERVYWFSFPTPPHLLYGWSMATPDSLYSPKKSMAAYRTMTAFLGGLEYVDSLMPENSGDHVYAFSDEKREVRVLWTEVATPSNLLIRRPNSGTSLYDIMGNPTLPVWSGEWGLALLEITEAPMYSDGAPDDEFEIIELMTFDIRNCSRQGPLSFTVDVTLVNPFATEIEGELSLQVPRGWQISGKQQVKLETQEKTVVSFGLSAPFGMEDINELIQGRLDIATPGLPASLRATISLVHEKPSIERPEHDIWIEAGKPSGANFAVEDYLRRATSAHDQVWISIESFVFPEGETSFALEYDFVVEESGTYRIMYGGARPGLSWTSPIAWSLDSSNYVYSSPPTEQMPYWPEGEGGVRFAWSEIGEVYLEEGSHSLHLRMDKPRADGRLIYRLDALYLSKE